MYSTTTGQFRASLFQTIKDVQSGKLPVEEAMATAALAKVMNDSMNTEINLARAVIMAKKEGVEVGRINKMGQNTIAYDDEKLIDMPEDEDE